MLKKLELQDCHLLYELLIDPSIFPFVRQKPACYDEYLFLTKKNTELEEEGLLISRTILDEWGKPIGSISLFDIKDKKGFVGTWLGKEYHGKGYNKEAKDAFFSECFNELAIEQIFMKIRKVNLRSVNATLKLPYVKNANLLYEHLYQEVNETESVFDLFVIEKSDFLFYEFGIETFQSIEDTEKKEA